MQRTIPHNSLLWSAVPSHVGVAVAFGYMLFHSLWARVVFGNYSFVICRLFFLAFVVSYFASALGLRLSDFTKYFRLPHKSDLAFVLGLTACTIVSRLSAKYGYNHYWPGVDDLDVSLRAIIDNCVIAPLSEEPVFRGVMLVCLASVLGERKWLLVLLSAVAFASVHNVFNFLPVVLAGTIYAVAFLRTKSLPFCISLHALWNALTFL